MTIGISKRNQLYFPGLQEISWSRVAGLVLFCCAYGFMGHTVVAQSSSEAESRRLERLDNRVDTATRDLSTLMRNLASHESTTGHPEMAARVLILEESSKQIQIELATYKAIVIWGGGLATGFLAILDLLNMLGVNIRKKPTRAPNEE